jgi:carboxyl-terminal processing protease
MRAFEAALQKLVDLGMRGLIMDLRFNPGGIVEQAIEMVDRFVGYGVIASTVTRRRAVKEYYANLRGTLERVELIVLINRGSASAAEIVSGSLQDHGRALLIGERSFGKGSIQHIMNLTSHEAAIKVTVAYYRLPGGRLIHRTPRNEHTDAWGVKPDVEIVLRDDEVKAIQESRHAIDAGLRNTSRQTLGVEVLRDRQLNEALSQMRGILKPQTATAD